jgi:hypothetical protein
MSGKTMIKIKTGKYKFRFEMSPLEHLLFLTVGRDMTQIQNFERRAFDFGGSCRHRLGSRTEPRIPLLERRIPVAV